MIPPDKESSNSAACAIERWGIYFRMSQRFFEFNLISVKLATFFNTYVFIIDYNRIIT